MLNRIARLALALCFALLSVATAQAATIVSASLGGDKVCTTLACSTQTHTFGGSSSVGSGGSLSISGTTLTFSINAGSATFNTAGSDPNLALAALSITGTATVLPVGGGAYAISSGSGSVAGTANASAFSSGTSAVGGTCTTVGGNLNCGITFAYQSSVGLPGTRAVLGQVNVQTPEPSLAALLGAGAIAACALGRRRR